MRRTIIAVALTLGGCAQTVYSPSEIAKIEMDIVRDCAVNRDQWVREMCQDTKTRQKIAEVQQARAQQERFRMAGLAMAQAIQENARRQHELAVAQASRPVIVNQPQVVRQPTNTNCWRTGNSVQCHSY